MRRRCCHDPEAVCVRDEHLCPSLLSCNSHSQGGSFPSVQSDGHRRPSLWAGCALRQVAWQRVARSNYSRFQGEQRDPFVRRNMRKSHWSGAKCLDVQDASFTPPTSLHASSREMLGMLDCPRMAPLRLRGVPCIPQVFQLVPWQLLQAFRDT